MRWLLLAAAALVACGGTTSKQPTFSEAAGACAATVASCEDGWWACDRARSDRCAAECGGENTKCFGECVLGDEICDRDRAVCVDAESNCTAARGICEDGAHVLTTGERDLSACDLSPGSAECKAQIAAPAPMICAQLCPEGIGPPADGCDYKAGEVCRQVDPSAASSMVDSDTGTFACVD